MFVFRVFDFYSVSTGNGGLSSPETLWICQWLAIVIVVRPGRDVVEEV